MKKKDFFYFWLPVYFLSTGEVQADANAYVSLGYQAAQLEIDDRELSGSGWILDAQYPVTQKLGVVGYLSRIGFEGWSYSEWQIGSRYQQDLFRQADIGFEYRYIRIKAESGDTESTADGHLGWADLSIMVSESSRSSQKGVLEIGGGIDVADPESVELLSLGYRTYLDFHFSLAVHLRQTGSDMHSITLSIREER